MPYTSPAAQSSGGVAPVSWATAVKAGLDYLANPPACRVLRSANQSINNNTDTAISWDTESYDTDTMHDTVTNVSRITIKTLGIYVVQFGCTFASNATGVRYLYGIQGGTVLLGTLVTSGLASDGPNLLGGFTKKFAVNDYFEIFVKQTSGGALNIGEASSGHERTFCSATWIGLG